MDEPIGLDGRIGTILCYTSYIMNKNSQECREVAQNPEKFAAWVTEYLLEPASEDDRNLSVPNEKMELWGISEEERQRDIDEIRVLRAVAAVTFMSRIVSYDYFAIFKKQVAASTCRIISGLFNERLIAEIEAGIDEYMGELGKESPIGFYQVYVNRAFPGNFDLQGKLLLSEVPAFRFKQFVDFHDIMLDGYSLLMHGMKYEDYEKARKLTDSDKEKI